MSYFPPTGSVVAFQSDPTKLQVTASVAGNINVTNIPSVSGTVNVGNFPVTQNVSGSVAAFVNGTVPVNAAGSVVAFQGTSPWVVAPNNSSLISISQGSVATVIIGGSIAASFNPPANQSVSGTVGANLLSSNASVISVPQGSVAVAIVSGSIAATFNPPANQSVSGVTGSSIIGYPNVNVGGSVVGFQGTSPWIVNFQNSSIFAVQVGSVISVNEVTRNDTLASIAGANLTSRLQTGDAAGRTIIKPFASEDATIISYTGSLVSGSVQLIQASAVGLKSYVTDFWIGNTGSVTTLVTIQGGDTSVLGKFIAPSGGGMSSPGLALPLKTTASQDLAFTVNPSTSVLYLTLKGYQAQ